MKNPLSKTAMGVGNLGEEETNQMTRMTITRAEKADLLGKLFVHANEASRSKARATAEKLFVQTGKVVSMKPNMQKTAEEAKPAAKKPAAKKPEQVSPLKTVEKVHKSTLDAVKTVAGVEDPDKKKDPMPSSKDSKAKTAAAMSGDLQKVAQIEKQACAKNVYECFEKKAHMTEAQRRYPELLKAAAAAVRPLVSQAKRPGVEVATGATPRQSSLSGGSA